jgi:hypothetical protein
MRLVDVALLQETNPLDLIAEAPGPIARGARVYVRLAQDDQAFLRERAGARRMAPATYAAMALAAHLRARTPLPTEELRALKESIAHLGALRRYLRQIALAVNAGKSPDAPTREQLMALFRVCEALRDHVKGLIRTNAASWENGRAAGT